MCGIIGAVAQRDVAPLLLEGLKRLEYRGYDSAGIAVINPEGKLERQRAVGKVKELASLLDTQPLLGKIGIAHTRWATHGKPCEENAHPLFSQNKIAIVHNGIIENHEILRKKLSQDGYIFESETDTEIIAHLLNQTLLKLMPDASQSSQENKKNTLIIAVQNTVKQLEGAYALAILDISSPDRLIVVRMGSPLVIGLGIGENFVGSDKLALLPAAQKFMYLEEGDLACIERYKVSIYNYQHQLVTRKIHQIDMNHDFVERGNYRHYMIKEIFEQPDAISNALEGRLGRQSISDEIFGHQAFDIFSKVKHIQIAACGTSYHAGLVARYWLEEIAGIPTQVEVASELRYRKNIVLDNTLFLTLSQSGETADTLSAQKMAQSLGYLAKLAICNVPESSLIRNADLSLMMHAGPEIGVASTKAFTSQLVCLLLLTLILGKHQKKINKSSEINFISHLQKLPKKIDEVLSLNTQIQLLAEKFEHKHHALFIGRATQYPIALEGALKLKEISYIHAEGYPAGELKHGPLALLDKEMPVIALAPNDELIEKVKSNIQEIHARGAQLIVFSDATFEADHTGQTVVMPMPVCNKILAPILYAVPLQLLAYHVAVLKGTDVDQPRNLAKSVTVE